MDIPIGPLIGSGKVADVHRRGELALKLYKSPSAKSSAFREAANLACLEGSGLPVPRVYGIVRHGARWGVLMTRARAVDTAEPPNPELLVDRIAALADLHHRIHAADGRGLPAVKPRLGASIERAPGLSVHLRKRLLRRLEALPDGDRLCHGDFHPWNVIGDGPELLIVDWLDAACGAPEADLCRSYVLMHSRSAEFPSRYVAAYLQTVHMDEGAVRAWLPVIAAARLAEDVPAEEESLLAWAADV